MSKYQPKEFENRIKKLWEQEKVYLTEGQISKVSTKGRSPSGRKMYCLSMFPYPSGAGLHVGHVRIYTGTDVMARYYKMKGFEVLHPMGWDAFGLPAENAAIKAKKNPMDIVPGNIATFKRQMQSLGLSYDWSREFATTDPNYYQWTQWLFIQFFKMGLLYKKNTPINWCPSCKTGLSEEEVLPNGTHERCGNAITKKDLPQWIFRITTYADRLLKDLEGLNWPEGILTMQRNWIGKKEGVVITHKVEDMDIELKTFSAFPAWLFADTFIVIAPEHPMVKELVKDTTYEKEVLKFVEEHKGHTKEELLKGALEKKGVFTGRYALDPFNKGRKMPVWLANFALMDFGTGIIRCSAHDVRDYEFAQKYNLKLAEVVERTDVNKPINAHDNKGILKDSGPFSGKAISPALIEDILNWIEKESIGKKETSFHLRDWIFSRQRYWGEPIPMVYCENCAKNNISWWDIQEGKNFQKTHQNISKVDQNISKEMMGWFPILEQSLPLQLPYVKSYEPTGTGESPLSQMKDFVSTTCPHCGSEGIRETDTMPNWAGSCWYFLAFSFWDKKKVNSNNKIQTSNQIENFKFQIKNSSWMPVDWYLGGAEHAVLHLLYARFWVKALQDLGLLDFSEPFLGLRNVGMVLAEDHRKMSKSWGNVINPDDVIAEFGADTLRIYEMFMAPFNMEIAWSTAALQGAYRFLNRIWQIFHTSAKIDGRMSDKHVQKLIASLHKTIKKVGEDIAATKFNTAIAAMMEFLNEWEKGNVGNATLPYSEAKNFLIILSPFAPFIAEQLWREVGKEKKSITLAAWPNVKIEQFDDVEIELPVQVNGKVRAVISVSSKAEKSVIENRALQEDKVKEYIAGKTYKAIYVQGKILNFVTGK